MRTRPGALDLGVMCGAATGAVALLTLLGLKLTMFPKMSWWLVVTPLAAMILALAVIGAIITSVIAADNRERRRGRRRA